MTSWYTARTVFLFHPASKLPSFSSVVAMLVEAKLCWECPFDGWPYCFRNLGGGTPWKGLFEVVGAVRLVMGARSVRWLPAKRRLNGIQGKLFSQTWTIVNSFELWFMNVTCISGFSSVLTENKHHSRPFNDWGNCACSPLNWVHRQYHSHSILGSHFLALLNSWYYASSVVQSTQSSFADQWRFDRCADRLQFHIVRNSNRGSGKRLSFVFSLDLFSFNVKSRKA